MIRTAAALATATTLAAVGLTGCGGGDPAVGSSATHPVSGTVTVFAAASLTDAFGRLGKDFEAAHPGVKVTFSFAGSSQLARQLNQGAPADVFASAAPKNMQQVTDAVKPATFAKNRLEIAVPKGNPGHISGPADFADAGRKLALCAEQVPCGAAAKAVFAAAGITPRPDSLEQDVKAALTKVRLGEVDAALVYRTDVLASAGAVEGIEFPEADKGVNAYPIATLAKAPNPAAAQAFVAYVLSGQARKVLTEAGFDSP